MNRFFSWLRDRRERALIWRATLALPGFDGDPATLIRVAESRALLRQMNLSSPMQTAIERDAANAAPQK